MNLIDPVHDCRLVGVVRAVTGIHDCALIIHGRPGCHSGPLGLQSQTSSQRYVNVVYSGLRSEEMVTGGEKRLKLAIENVYKVMKPKLIVVASASAAGIMGDDVDGVIGEISSSVKCRIVHISACGYSGPEWTGYEDALVKIVETVLEEYKSRQSFEKTKNRISIVGFHPDEPFWRGDLQELINILKEILNVDISVVLNWCSIEEISNIVNSDLVVVLGGDGLSVADYLKKNFNIEYIVTPYPIGIKNTIDMIYSISSKLGIDINTKKLEAYEKYVRDIIEDFQTYVEGIYGNVRCVIVGESSRAFSLANFLLNELDFDIEYIGIRSRNYVTDSELLKWKNSEILNDRYELYKKILEISPEVVYGSTFERDIALRCGCALVRYCYPTLDRVYMSDRTIVGFRGAITLIEETINEMLNMQEKTELAYLSKMNDTKLLER